MDFILMITYIISAVAGSTLIKMGSEDNTKTIFTIPIVSMHISMISILGIVAYGVSFITYIILLTKLDLSFVHHYL